MSIGHGSRVGQTSQPPLAAPWLWWLAIAAVAGLLGLLAWAEVRWLPTQLPREFTAHTALVVTAPSQEPTTEQLARALGLPGAESRVRTEVAVPVEGAPSEVAPPAPIRLEIESRCIQFAAGTGGGRGLLVTAVARGEDRARLEAGVAAWQDSLAERARRASPSVRVAPLGTVSAPYHFCQER